MFTELLPVLGLDDTCLVLGIDIRILQNVTLPIKS